MELEGAVTSKPVEILLVEDNPGDVVLTQEALAEGKIRNHLSVARDGEEAIRFLLKDGEFANAATPDLILLDLNLPKKNGIEVLKVAKDSEHLRRIPVVVLTTSSADADLVATYNLHANCFISKPVDFERFIDLIQEIEDFWLQMVRLPARADN